jgi:CRP-like cAMP-binding protein
MYLCNDSKKEFVTVAKCLDSLSGEEREKLENSVTLIEYKKNETIIKQGYVASHVLLIEEGIVKIDVTNDGRISTVGLLNSGCFVGLMCSFACSNMAFSSVALDETLIRMYDMKVFQELIKGNNDFAMNIIKHMSAMTNYTLHWVTRKGKKNVVGALAIVLLDFSRVFESLKFDLPVSRIGLAEIVGFSKESVIHALSRINKEELISVDGKNIEILEPDKLKSIIEKA